MRFFVKIAGLAAAVAIGLAAQAAGAHTASTPPDCAAPATQAAMNACASEDFLAASAGYAERSKAISRKLSGKQRALFLRSQTAWLAYRTAACEFESSAVLGGSAHGMVKWQCAARMTRAQTLALGAVGTCPEGDISCVRLVPSSMPAAPDQRRP